MSAMLDRRILGKATLITEAAAWQDDRDKRRFKADWQFTTDEARCTRRSENPSMKQPRWLVAPE